MLPKSLRIRKEKYCNFYSAQAYFYIFRKYGTKKIMASVKF